MKSFTIGKNDANQRADKFIAKVCPLLPKGMMYKYIRIKRIKCNGKRIEISQRLNVGDVVEMYVNDEFFGDKKADLSFLDAPDKVNIIFEDENILIADKPSGLVVHSDESGSYDTLINRILNYLYKSGEYSPEKELSFTPALCNRLDRNTQGLVICAKNAEALRIINEKIKSREIKKSYLCITTGIPKEKQACLKAYHSREDKIVKIYDSPKNFTKEIITEYRVLAESKADNLALLEVNLVTGRTHQIRAHLAHIGCPILGDRKYGINKVSEAYNVKSQALCAYRLEFDFKESSDSFDYLNGKAFTVDEVWFVDKFFPNFKLDN
ncbi:MAG: RluA family pseudouridine synthase [Ruminococcus sp.]|nr:RluA family pseudouridine synthase [Ruminococcus sp.]